MLKHNDHALHFGHLYCSSVCFIACKAQRLVVIGEGDQKEREKREMEESGQSRTKEAKEKCMILSCSRNRYMSLHFSLPYICTHM